MASSDGDSACADVSDAAQRTRRSGATATLWRDTVIIIGGRNRQADGCVVRRGWARRWAQGHTLMRPWRLRSGEFFTEVLSFSLKDQRWSSLGECVPPASR
jgi:hypothetical protein